MSTITTTTAETAVSATVITNKVPTITTTTAMAISTSALTTAAVATTSSTSATAVSKGNDVPKYVDMQTIKHYILEF